MNEKITANDLAAVAREVIGQVDSTMKAVRYDDAAKAAVCKICAEIYNASMQRDMLLATIGKALMK